MNAKTQATVNLKRPKVHRLVADTVLHNLVNEGLAHQWSPQQISRRLLKDYPGQADKHVSHETIYQTLFLQAKGELHTELKVALRTGRVRRKHWNRTTGPRPGQIKDMVNISERPATADDRAVPGFWEGDLIIGKGGKSQIATLVERTTRLVMLVRIPYDRRADRVAPLLAQKMSTLPEFMQGSITWDQGKEMADHKKFTIATSIPIYFCDPHSPWQRGSNENTNGLLRQYFPKGTDLSGYTQADLDKVAILLNGRPRRSLDYDTPHEKYSELLETHAGASTN
jgi:transposase, IS30 family